MRRWIGPGCALAVSLAVFPAHGQQATPIRYNEGPGVKLGRSLVLHPGISAEGRYDSNVLFADRGRRAAPYLRLIGHLDLATRSAQRLTDATTGKVALPKVQFRMKGAAAYREYFSGDDAVVNQRAVEVDAGMNLRLFPRRLFSFELDDDFSRTVMARNYAVLSAPGGTTPVVNSGQTLTRDINRGTARAILTPGGGRLIFSLAYSIFLYAFEQSAFNFANKLAHQLDFKGKWKLLPKTALTLEVIQQFVDYLEDNPGGNVAPNVNSKPLKVYAGFVGLLTPKISALLRAGYGNSLHESGDSYNMLIAQAEMGFRITPTAKIKAGYQRDFNDSPFGNFYSDDMAYVGYDHMIINRFLLHLDGRYRFRQYNGFQSFSGTSFPDGVDMHLFTGALTFDWVIRPWVYVGVGYDIMVRQLPTTPTSGSFVGLVSYVRHQVFGKVGFSY